MHQPSHNLVRCFFSPHTARLCSVIFYVLTSASLQGAPNDFPVVIQTVDVNHTTGKLISLSTTDGATILLKEKEKSFSVIDLVSITTSVKRLANTQQETVITLTGGDVLNGYILQGDRNNIKIETRDLGTIQIPLDVVAGVDTARAFTPSYRESAQWLVRNQRSGEDQILLTNGDVLKGFITAIDTQAISIEGEMGNSQIPLQVVVSARFSSLAPVKPEQVYFIATLQSSGRITLSELEWSERKMKAKLFQGSTVSIDPKFLVRIDVEGGRWNWITENDPVHYEFTPLVSVRWPFVHNLNVLGEPLKVADQIYYHGIGVHSRSKLTYDLRGKYLKFVTSFGMDDHSGMFADVSIRIIIDGSIKYQKEHLRRGELHGPIRLDLQNAKKIELVVDYGDNGDLQDRFNWIDTALIR